MELLSAVSFVNEGLPLIRSLLVCRYIPRPLALSLASMLPPSASAGYPPLRLAYPSRPLPVLAPCLNLPLSSCAGLPSIERIGESACQALASPSRPIGGRPASCAALSALLIFDQWSPASGGTLSAAASSSAPSARAARRAARTRLDRASATARNSLACSRAYRPAANLPMGPASYGSGVAMRRRCR